MNIDNLMRACLEIEVGVIDCCDSVEFCILALYTYASEITTIWCYINSIIMP